MQVIILNVCGLAMMFSQAFRRFKKYLHFHFKNINVHVIIRCLRSGDAVLPGVLWKSHQPSLHQGVQVCSSLNQGVQVGSSESKSRSAGRFKQF
jgi:hypothetical protein